MSFIARLIPSRLARPLRNFVALLLAGALVGCGGGGGGSAGPSPELAGRVVQGGVGGYAFSVYLPASYDNGTRSYPVIYAVEGDARFGYGSSQETRFDAFRKVMQQRGTQAILVGIGGTAQRGIDFLLPGATHYHAFLVEDLIPHVDSEYRTEPGRRALSGLSHGGHFVNIALFIEGTSGTLNFSHFLSTETSTGGEDPGVFLAREQAMYEAGRPLPTTVFLAAGAAGTTNEPQVTTLYRRMLDHDYEGLTLLNATYPTSHVGADLPAFEEALERFFP